MALSLGKYGIRVNAICPGFTDTPHLQNWLAEKQDIAATKTEMISLLALGRIGKPDDVAKLAIYLGSDDAEIMKGSTIVLDAGLSSRLYHADYC